MTRYVIDVERVESCQYCPMNYDFVGCRAYMGDKARDPLVEWQVDGSPDRRPERCPLVEADDEHLRAAWRIACDSRARWQRRAIDMEGRCIELESLVCEINHRLVALRAGCDEFHDRMAELGIADD